MAKIQLLDVKKYQKYCKKLAVEQQRLRILQIIENRLDVKESISVQEKIFYKIIKSAMTR